MQLQIHAQQKILTEIQLERLVDGLQHFLCQRVERRIHHHVLIVHSATAVVAFARDVQCKKHLFGFGELHAEVLLQAVGQILRHAQRALAQVLPGICHSS